MKSFALLVVYMMMIARCGRSIKMMQCCNKWKPFRARIGFGGVSRLSMSSMPVTPAKKQPRSTTLTVRKTGAFKRELPDIFVSQTHFKRAMRKLKDIKPDVKIKNQRDRQRRYCASTLDGLMKGLTIPITEIMDNYKYTFKKLHPFEATVADLVIKSRVKKGLPDLSHIMSEVKTLRSSTSKLAKEYASQASKAASAIEAKDLLEEGTEKLKELYNSTMNPQAICLEQLVDLQKDLRRIPVLELDTLTLVLVGTPNVGKSSIVRDVSSGTPEINNYPFTTRSVTIGHIVNKETEQRFQVMDTPGLLDRPVEDRNEMEKLTFASLAHLPTAVMFVIDPSGLAGEQSNLQAQLNVRKMLRERFPRRPWVDVVSKADLDIPQEVMDQMPEGYLNVSVKEGISMDKLRAVIEDLLGNKLKTMLNSIKEQKSNTNAEPELDAEVD